MAAEDTSSALSLKYSPTWALATVCFIIISISILIEHCISLLIRWLDRYRKNELKEAVQSLKSELMRLGFISLLLAVIQEPVSRICIPAKVADTMLPCRKEPAPAATSARALFSSMVWDFEPFEIETGAGHGLYGGVSWQPHRRLSGNESSGAVVSDFCTSKGMVSFVSQAGMKQLHVFIFVLAVMQIVYCVLTMAFGRAKMRRWKAWEEETRTVEYEVANDPYRFRLVRQTTFGRRHMNSCIETSLQLWIKCFFRQFFQSVAKVDYLTLRHGFISAHLSSRHNNFNFQKYSQRSLEEDFKVVVVISPLMWLIVVIFLLMDVHGWNVYLWVSCAPLLVMLVLGTKLEVIVARMALRMRNQSDVVRGAPLVRPDDSLFWFRNPRFVLTLLHFTLFMNAFEMAFFIWVTIEFGLESCYHKNTVVIVTRVALAVTVQVLCSYITLPLYALVTQMGSRIKGKVLEEKMAKIMKQWHAEVRDKRKKREQLSLQMLSPCASFSAEWSPRNSSVSAIEFSSLTTKPTAVMVGDSSKKFSSRRRIIEEQLEIVREEESAGSHTMSNDDYAETI
ncbi:MLO-like protein 3 isoform X2 [Malania oleifera]|uniref:MLO-like protein 3 isoform X2 n=1 Tax=Malania oleifera TaxID=397392 RepID=UPI0025ADEFB3|nr:MLO-like protein 3 isoform X2 [Malania oleifera]